jgi:hypothetical protein
MKTPTQRFFERVEMYNVGTNPKEIEQIYQSRIIIEDETISDILNLIKDIEDSGLPVKKDVPLGLLPEEPDPMPQQVEQDIIFSFLRELEHEGIVRTVERKVKDENDELGNHWSEVYAEISFYPQKLKNYILNELPYIRQNKNQKKVDCYITKEGEDFMYNGKLLNNIGKGTRYYIVFDTLFSLLHSGGKTTYGELGIQIKKRIKGTTSFSKERMAKFIQDNLSIHNGFLHHTNIENPLPNGKELIHVIRGYGIEFNNPKGS